MRPRVEWMNQTDDRILEALEESEMTLTPVVLAKNLDYSRSWVSTRLSKLKDEGFVENTDGSFYKITDIGVRYLKGELTEEELK